MATKRMYVWYSLPSLRDYSDGIMVVIATSKDRAIRLAVDNYAGPLSKTSNAWQLERRSKILTELLAEEPEVISTGAVHMTGGS